MIAAVDTNVLLDVFLADWYHGPRSNQWLRRDYDQGAVLICDLVYAELAPAFDSREALDDALREISTESETDQIMAGCTSKEVTSALSSTATAKSSALYPMMPE